MPGVATTGGPDRTVPGANGMLALLLVINLFNYIDRQVLSAVLPRLQRDAGIVALDDPNAQLKLGALTSAFMASYMALSLVFGWLDGRGYRRWVIIGIGVTLWSIASGSSGLAAGYGVLLLTRCCVGIGEAAYGPIATAMLADLYPLAKRGKVIAVFNMAIPVGSALGFLVGGIVADAFGDWRHAFYVTYSGLLLGLVCFLVPEPPRPVAANPAGGGPGYGAILRELAGNRSYVLCCLGMTAIVFVIGGVAAWVPAYVYERQGRFALTEGVIGKLEAPPADAKWDPVPPAVAAKLRPLADGVERPLPEMKARLAGALDRAEAAAHAQAVFDAAATAGTPTLVGLNVTFGAILVVGGFAATGLGAWIGERLRTRVRGAYFWVIGGGALFALPCFVGMLYVPFPYAWGLIFLAILGLFAHTGPAFTLLANVVRSPIRAAAFAINILVIHALGDAISPTIIGAVADATNLNTAFLFTSGFILVGAVLWMWAARDLDADTARAEAADRAAAEGAPPPPPLPH